MKTQQVLPKVWIDNKGNRCSMNEHGQAVIEPPAKKGKRQGFYTINVDANYMSQYHPVKKIVVQ